MNLINCGEVDAVEICTTNYLHVKMAVDAVAAGKPINIEKPLSADRGGRIKVPEDSGRAVGILGLQKMGQFEVNAALHERHQEKAERVCSAFSRLIPIPFAG